MARVLTCRQFKELCKKHEPLYVGDEYKDKKHWRVFAFSNIEGEYHELAKRSIDKKELKQIDIMDRDNFNAKLMLKYLETPPCKPSYIDIESWLIEACHYIIRAKARHNDVG
jgi:hypothetical protein